MSSGGLTTGTNYNAPVYLNIKRTDGSTSLINPNNIGEIRFNEGNKEVELYVHSGWNSYSGHNDTARIDTYREDLKSAFREAGLDNKINFDAIA